MANRIEYSVTMTPIKEVTYTVDYDNSNSDVTDVSGLTHTYVEPTIGKSLGGSGSITVNFTGVAKAYVNGNAGTLAATSKKFLIIKHTGKEYDSTSATKTTDEDAEVTLSFAYTDGTPDPPAAASIQIAKLNKGEAICIPHPNFTITLASAGTKTVALEYAWTAS